MLVAMFSIAGDNSGATFWVQELAKFRLVCRSAPSSNLAPRNRGTFANTVGVLSSVVWQTIVSSPARCGLFRKPTSPVRSIRSLRRQDVAWIPRFAILR